ncbi:DUF6053 domain-containing protein [Lysobacter enzymogenes]
MLPGRAVAQALVGGPSGPMLCAQFASI